MSIVAMTAMLLACTLDTPAFAREASGSNTVSIGVLVEVDAGVLASVGLSAQEAAVFSLKARVRKMSDGSVVESIAPITLTKDSRRHWRGNLVVPKVTVAGGYYVEIYPDGSFSVDLNGDGVYEITPSKVETVRAPLRVDPAPA